jgi:tetratricopeptide (TPR) repeat protein/outer membrane protein assembly factor BamB
MNDAHEPVRTLRLVAAIAVALALPGGGSAAADEWQVKRTGQGAVFAQRYKRILEGRPEMGFAFKRLLQLSGAKGGAQALADEYAKKIEKSPRNWKLQVLRGHLLRHLGQHEAAAKAYTAARELANDEHLPAYAHAELLALMRQSVAAEKAYEAALSLAKKHEQKRACLTKLAALALREGKVERAKDRFRALLAVGPKDLQAREDLAALLARYGLHEEALREYEAIRKKIRLDNLKVALTLREIGALRDKLGKPEEAIRAYAEALRLLSRTHWLRRELGERIVDVHRKRGTLGELAQDLGRRGAKDVDALLSLAKIEEELGQEAKAVATLRRVLRKRPNDSEARLKLIDLLEGAQQPDAALTEYVALVKRDAGDPEHRLRLARAYLRRGQRDAAAKTLRDAEKKFKKSVAVLKAVFDLCSKHGLAADAQRILERLVALDPRDPELRRQLGDLALAQGKMPDAEKNWSDVVRSDPNPSQGYARLAQIYLGHNLVEKAVEALEKALQADPKNVEARIELARALARAGRVEDSLVAWKDCWRRAVDASHLRTAEQQLLAIWEQQGSLAEVVVEMRRAFESDPKDLRTGRLLGALFHKTRDWVGAETTYQSILKTAPDDVETLLDLERLYAARGEIEKARSLVIRAAELDKRRAKQHYKRAVEYTLKAHSPKEAIELVRRVVELNPVDPDAHGQLAELYEKAGRESDAMQVYTRAIQLAPRELKYQLALGDLQRRAGKPGDAFATYRAVIAGSNDEAVVLDATKRIIALAREQGRIAELERDLKQLSAANPKSMAHYHALAELYRSQGRTSEVDQIFERASRRTTDRSSALGLLAAQAREKGDVRRAIAYMRRQILEASKPSASQYRALAELYFEIGDTERARNVIEEMIRTVGDKARSWQTAAALYQKYQFPDDALSALAKQVEHNPADLATKLRLAKSYVDADRLREAERLLNEIVDSAIGVGPSLGRKPQAQPTPGTIAGMPQTRFRRHVRKPPSAVTTANAGTAPSAGDLRRDALSLLVGIYERWGSADALTARLEKGLGDRRKARQLLSDLVAIYRLRGQTDKVAELLGKGVALFPRETTWHALLAEVEAERGRLAESLKIYLRLERDVDPANARTYALKRVQLHLDGDREKEAMAAVLAFAKAHERPVGFLTRAADLFAGRGSFLQAVGLLERAGREDAASRTLVRDKLVEYQIAAGKRADAAAVMAEALDDETRRPVPNPTGVYALREAKLRRYFELIDRIAKEKLVLRRQAQAKAEPTNLLVHLDLHLAGVLLGNEPAARLPLATLLELGYRDKRLASVTIERLVLAGEFTRLAEVVRPLFARLGDSQERKRIAEMALGHMRAHRRVPPEALAELLVTAQLGANPGASEHRNTAQLYAVWGNYQKAATYYEEALKRSPGDPDLYRELGQIYQQTGRAAEAKAIYQQAIARGALPIGSSAPPGADPLERALHQMQALLAFYRVAGEVGALEKRLGEAADKHPVDALAHYELAGLLQALGNRGRALAVVERLAKARPNDAEVLEVLGRLYKDRGDYRTSAKLFEEALARGSFRKRNVYRDLIFSYRRIGEEKRAFELEKRMAWEMGDEFAMYRLALQLQKDGLTADSVKAYKRYLSLKYARFSHLSGRRRTLRVALELAKFLLRAQLKKEALVELEAYLPMVRGIPVSSFERRNFIQRLTSLYQSVGVLNQKLSEWEDRSKQDSFFLDLLYHFHETRGNAAEKLRLLERTVELRPRDEGRIEALAEEYARRGRYDDAIRALRRLEGFASTANYLLRIGNLHHYKGQRKLALSYWRKHVEAQFQYPTYRDFRSRRLFALAEILDREGYRELAEKSRIEAVEAAAAVDAYQYGRIIGEYVRRSSYDSAVTITLKAMEKVTDPQQRRNLLYALLPYGYYAVKHLAGLRSAVELRKSFEGAENEGDPRADLAHLFYEILGERYRSAGNEGKAAEAFEMALGYKDEPETQNALIAIYKRLGKEAQVARIYERLLVRKPNHSPYLRAAADAYLRIKDSARALPLLERDAAANPNTDTFLKIYEIHRARGQLAKAEEPLVAARRRAQGSMDVIEKMEQLYRDLGDTVKLENFYAGLSRAIPIPAADLPRLAALMERGGKAYGAVEVYKLAYTQTPPGSWLRRQAQEKLTQALTRLGHADLADEELLRELPQATQRYPIHQRLADLLRQHGMGEKALVQMKRAAFLAPHLSVLWQRAVELAQDLGLEADAKALLQWGLAVHPGSADLAKLSARAAGGGTVAKSTLRRVLWRRGLGRCAVAPAIAQDLVIAVDCPGPKRGRSETRESVARRSKTEPAGQRPHRERAPGTVATDVTGPVRIIARSLRDGARRWVFTLPELEAPVTRDGATIAWSYRVTGIVVAGDRAVAAINEDQFESAPGIGTGRVRKLHLVAVRVRDGRALWRRTYAGDYAGGEITIAHSSVFLHGQNLRAFSLDTGRPLWSAYAGSNAYGWIFDQQNVSRPVAAGGLVFAAGKDGKLYAFDGATGESRWTFTAAAPIHATPLATADAVYFIGDDGYAHAVDAGTGKPRWRQFVGGDPREETKTYSHGYFTRPRQRGAPAADAARVYFATGGGLVVALGRQDGRVAWKRKLVDRTARDLTLADGRLLVAGEQRALYSLQAERGEILWQYVRPTGARAITHAGIAVAILGSSEGEGSEQRLVAFDVANDALFEQRSGALARIADGLERARDHAMLEALLRNVASPIDSSFRHLHLKLMRLRAESGDVGGVLESASRLLTLRDGDAAWFDALDQAIRRAFERRPIAAVTTPAGLTRAPVAVAQPRDPESALRAFLDAMPVDERRRGVAGELLLLKRAGTMGERLVALGRLRAIKSRLAIPFLHELTEVPSADVRMIAGLSLAELDDYSAKDALREAARAQQASRRRTAVQHIARSFVPDDAEALRIAVSDSEAPVRIEAARALLEHERHAGAIDVMRAALSAPDDEVKIRAALALGRHGDRTGVRLLANLARVRRGPLQAQAADALYELGDRSVLPILLDHRQKDGGASMLSTVRLVIGNIHLLMEDDRNALLEYRSIAAFDPDLDKAWANIGWLYLLRGRNTDAIEALNEAVRRNPFLASALAHRAQARARAGDLEGALSDARLALARNPEHRRAHISLLEVLVRKGMFEQAAAAALAIAKRFSAHADVHDALARLYSGRANRAFADFGRALKHAQRATTLRPENTSYLITLAESHLLHGALDDAQRAARAALRHAVGERMRARVWKLISRIKELRERPRPVARAGA